MKARFGKYKRSEVDEHIQSLKDEHQAQINSLNATIEKLREENEKLLQENRRLAQRERIIASVLIEATQKATEIEERSKMQAANTEKQVENIKNEWKSRISSCKDTVQSLQAYSSEIIKKIQDNMQSLAELTTESIEKIQNMTLSQPESADKPTLEEDIRQPQISTEELQQAILKSANADLYESCKALGLLDDDRENNS